MIALGIYVLLPVTQPCAARDVIAAPKLKIIVRLNEPHSLWGRSSIAAAPRSPTGAARTRSALTTPNRTSPISAPPARRRARFLEPSLSRPSPWLFPAARFQGSASGDGIMARPRQRQRMPILTMWRSSVFDRLVLALVLIALPVSGKAAACIHSIHIIYTEPIHRSQWLYP
jgi:hypothetical protein